MTDDEFILHILRMRSFGELFRSADDGWWCYVYETTKSGRQERHAGGGDTAAMACRRAVAQLEKATGKRGRDD